MLECSWKGLIDKVSCAEDLDEVIRAHEEFLDKITGQCLLDPASQPILTRLRAIYDLIIMFQQKQVSMFSASLKEVDRRRGLEQHRDNLADQVIRRGCGLVWSVNRFIEVWSRTETRWRVMCVCGGEGWLVCINYMWESGG